MSSEEYGKSPSFEEAIDNLAVVCQILGIPVPTKIVFPKGSLLKISALFYQERVQLQPKSLVNAVVTHNSTGAIGIEEEK
jgi:hypothetical protein